MTDAAAQVQPQPARRNQKAILFIAAVCLLGLLALGTWKSLQKDPLAIKLNIKPLPALNIGTGRVSITHGINSSDWVVHSADAAGVNMVIERNEFLGSYSYKFQSTRAGAAGGRGGNRFGGGLGGRGAAQTSPGVANILSHADLLKLSADQEAAIAAIEPADLAVAQLDPTDEQTAIGQWLDLLSAPDENGKTAAEWELLGTLNSISAKLAPYEQLPNAMLDSFLNPAHPNGILSTDQMVIYRKLERQAATQPATQPLNNRGNRGNAVANNNAGAGAGRGNGAGNQAVNGAANPTANRANNAPANTNRAGAPGSTTPPIVNTQRPAPLTTSAPPAFSTPPMSASPSSVPPSFVPTSPSIQATLPPPGVPTTNP